jgi:uncharacterized membrane protein (UPF0136 family)
MKMHGNIDVREVKQFASKASQKQKILDKKVNEMETEIINFFTKNPSLLFFQGIILGILLNILSNIIEHYISANSELYLIYSIVTIFIFSLIIYKSKRPLINGLRNTIGIYRLSSKLDKIIEEHKDGVGSLSALKNLLVLIENHNRNKISDDEFKKQYGKWSKAYRKTKH